MPATSPRAERKSKRSELRKSQIFFMNQGKTSKNKLEEAKTQLVRIRVEYLADPTEFDSDDVKEIENLINLAHEALGEIAPHPVA